MSNETSQYLSKHVRDISAALAKEGVVPPFYQQVTGLVAVLDLSGYSVLTTQLVSLGNIAAEILTRVVSTFFDQLIRKVDSCGGDIIKFVGDAIIVYWKPLPSMLLDELAANTVLCLMQLLQEMGTYPVYVPELDLLHHLTMHVGFGYGRVNHSHVGVLRERWEHVMSGEAVNDACANLTVAEPGELVLSANTWRFIKRRLDPYLVSEERGEYIVLTSFKKIGRVSYKKIHSSVHFSDDMICHRYLNESFRYWLERGYSTPTNQLRDVTIVFTRIAASELHSTGTLLEQNELQKAFRTIHELIKRFGGVLYSFTVDDKGAAVLSVFGLPPFAHENNAFVALQCCMALRNHLHRLFKAFSIGVSTGRIFVGTIGNHIRRDYALVSDTINVAVRLMSIADSRESVICDNETQELCKSLFEFSASKFVKVKGKQNDICIFEPLKSLNTKMFETYEGEFIGRSEILKTISKTLTEFQETLHVSLLIEGEPGDDKSKFAEYILREAQSRDLVTCSCVVSEIEKHTPYYLYRNVFEELFTFVDEYYINRSANATGKGFFGSTQSMINTTSSGFRKFPLFKNEVDRQLVNSRAYFPESKLETYGLQSRGNSTDFFRSRDESGENLAPEAQKTKLKRFTSVSLGPPNCSSTSTVSTTYTENPSSLALKIGIDHLRQLSQLGKMKTVVEEEIDFGWQEIGYERHDVASSQVWFMEDTPLRATLHQASVRDYFSRRNEQRMARTVESPYTSENHSIRDDELFDRPIIEERIRRCLRYLGIDVALAPFLNVVFQTNFPTTSELDNISGRLRAKFTRLLLLKIIQTISDLHSVALIFDDCQWQDSGSRALTEEIVEKCDRVLICMLMIKQVDDPFSEKFKKLPFVTHVEISGLSIADTRTLALKVLGPPAKYISDALAEKICQQTGGKPFFIETFVKGLQEQGHLTIVNHHVRIKERSLAGSEEASISHSAPQRNLILSLYDRLSGLLQSILRYAAAIGQKFSFEDLLEIMKSETTADELMISIKKLEDYGFLVTVRHQVFEGRLSFDCHFKSAVHKEAISSLIPYSTHQDIRAKLAAFYETRLIQSGDDRKYLPLVCYHYNATHYDAKKIRFLYAIAKMYVEHACYEEAIQATQNLLDVYQNSALRNKMRTSRYHRVEWQIILGEAHLWRRELSLAQVELLKGIREFGFFWPNKRASMDSWIHRLIKENYFSSSKSKKRPWIYCSAKNRRYHLKAQLLSTPIRQIEDHYVKEASTHWLHYALREQSRNVSYLADEHDIKVLTTHKNATYLFMNSLELLQSYYSQVKEEKPLLFVALLLYQCYSYESNKAATAKQAALIAMQLLNTSFANKAARFMWVADQLAESCSDDSKTHEFVKKVKGVYYFIRGKWKLARSLLLSGEHICVDIVTELYWDELELSTLALEICTGNFWEMGRKKDDHPCDTLRKGDPDIQSVHSLRCAIYSIIHKDFAKNQEWINLLPNLDQNITAETPLDLFRVHAVSATLNFGILKNSKKTMSYLLECGIILKTKKIRSSLVLVPLLCCAWAIFGMALEDLYSPDDLKSMLHLLEQLSAVALRCEFHVLAPPIRNYCNSLYWIMNGDSAHAVFFIKQMLDCSILKQAGILNALAHHLLLDFVDDENEIYRVFGRDRTLGLLSYPQGEEENANYERVRDIFKRNPEKEEKRKWKKIELSGSQEDLYLQVNQDQASPQEIFHLNRACVGLSQ